MKEEKVVEAKVQGTEKKEVGIQVGDFVEAVWDKDGKVYKGIVLEVKEGEWQTLRAGDEIWQGKELKKIEPPKVGDKVWGKKEDGKWYWGKLAEIKENGKYAIKTKDEVWEGTEVHFKE